MDYFHILNLEREPFSNSPDPACFYHSRQHLGCLQKLELSLRLRRGLNVVTGEVGTGKTTLCRQLIQRFSGEGDIETHLILDPDVSDASAFLATVGAMICGEPVGSEDGWRVKERIKAALFEKGVEQGRTVVLIIDEGQKIHPVCLEILRELLNYETNEAKLLQIVIFAQTEFDRTLEAHANVADRISLYHRLGPLNFSDTANMIRFRLARAGGRSDSRSFFTWPAMVAIYRATGGYPRKIIHLCHKSVLAMIIQNRSRVGWMLVRACVERSHGVSRRRRTRPALAVTGAAAILGLALVIGTGFEPLKTWLAEWSVPTPSKTDSAMASRSPQRSPEMTGTAATLAPRTDAPAESGGGEAEASTRALSAAAPWVEPPIRTDAGGEDPPMPKEMPAPAIADEPTPTVPRIPQEGPKLSVAAEGASDGPGEPPWHVAEAPAWLGNAALQENEILSWLMIKLYGDFNRGLLDRIARANPQIADTDDIPAGTPIQMPAVKARLRRRGKGGCWAQLGQTADLSAALDFLRSYPPNTPAARLVPHWHPDTGLRFSVVLWTRFADAQTARQQLRILPQGLSEGRGAVCQWDAEETYFADPYAVR